MVTTRKWWVAGLVLACAAACERQAPPQEAADAETADAETAAEGVSTPQQAWWDRLQALCGQAFAGELARYDEALDADWMGRDMVMHVRECAEDEVRIPFHVGEDRSRTWVLTRTDEGIELKHDHRHSDGTEDATTWYGGHTAEPGTETRQAFPADEHSRTMFEAQGHPDGVQNVWIVEIHPADRFSYNLTRFNRDFRVDFDLSAPVEPPPPPWGAGPAPSGGA